MKDFTKSKAEAKELAKIFPSMPSSTAVSTSGSQFDPNVDLVVRKQKYQKKSTNVKPSTVEVVLLSTFSMSIPRGMAERSLKDTNRVYIDVVLLRRPRHRALSYVVILRPFQQRTLLHVTSAYDDVHVAVCLK